MGANDDIKVLITGANGFVGPHLAATLRRQFGARMELLLTSRVKSAVPDLGTIEELDVTDADAVDQVIARFRPSHVIHLAGVAAIPAAIANAAVVWQVHLFGTLNIANAILSRVPACTLVFIGSGQVYGASARSGRPLDEATMLAPTNGYEATKAAADLAGEVLGHHGRVCGGDHQVKIGPAVSGSHGAARRAVHPEAADTGVPGGQAG